jgi:hypothetical protein
MPERRARLLSADGHEPGPDTLTGAQRRRVKQRSADQDRTLLAMQQLEAALGTATSGQ